MSARRYADPYLAGVALGLVLLASFVIAGRGLGASGAFATAAATTVRSVAPSVASSNGFLATHLDAGGMLNDWLVVEILGLTYREAAQVFGVPEGTVKSRMADARQRLLAWMATEEAADEM